jgi:hypothetical protein
MIVSGDPNGEIGEAIAESLRRASQKAKERNKKRFAENKEVIGKCAACGNDIHINDEHCEGRNGKTYCANCKPKSAKKFTVIPGVFAFNDVLHELDDIVKKKRLNNEPKPKKKDKKHPQ